MIAIWLPEISFRLH